MEFSGQQERLKAWGDLRLLRLTLANVVGNAWKLSEKDPEAKIAFSRDAELDRTRCVPVCYVRNEVDFGISYVDKLFEVFHRLHALDEFQDMGIGLVSVTPLKKVARFFSRVTRWPCNALFCFCRRSVPKHGNRLFLSISEGESVTKRFSERKDLASGRRGLDERS
jgi:hypothetical protein